MKLLFAIDVEHVAAVDADFLALVDEVEPFALFVGVGFARVVVAQDGEFTG